MPGVLKFFLTRLYPWLVFTHATLFIAFWLSNSLFYASTNDYLADMLGKRLDYVRLLLCVSVVIALWSLGRGLLSAFGRTHKLSTLTAWLFGLISIVYVVFFYGSFKLLFSESPVQLVRLGQLLGYFRLLPDALLLLLVSLLSALLLRAYLRKKAPLTLRQRWLVLIPLLIFLALWFIPPVFPPASAYYGVLPEKPPLVAHRGASMLAPENTAFAANLANDLGAYGLETDIQVSRDGHLFLLHDDTFDRTTNASSVFPGRENEPAANFTLAEIQQLDAGQWFTTQDPFGTVARGWVPAYPPQRVPVLADWLDILRTSQRHFIFDLKPPPANHPYAGSFFDLALDQIHQAGIDAQVWFLVDGQQLQALRQVAPGMAAAYGADYTALPAPQDLTAQGYQVLNVEYGIAAQSIREYRAAGMWVNVYTVDEPWQFSRLWLLGVDSITTSNIGTMVALDKPVFSLRFTSYLLVWALVGLAGIGLLAGLLLPVALARRP